MKNSYLDVSESFFTGKAINDVLVLSFREKPLLHVLDLNAKQTLLDYLDRVDRCDEIKALLVRASPGKMKRDEYIAFYRRLTATGFDKLELERMYNAIGQIILKLVDLNKLVVHVDSGTIVLLFMNIGLACDYRIVADDTVYQNPNIELQLVPKGACVFFLSNILGAVAAQKILLSGEDIPAGQALDLGLVDEVVPLMELDRSALAAARRFARLPGRYSIGIKKLLHYNARDLSRYLEFENELLRAHTFSRDKNRLGR